MTAYRVGAFIGIVEPYPSGFGPTVYVGELRTLDDHPIRAAVNPDVVSRGQHYWFPVSFGITPEAVLALLSERAAR